MRALWRRMYPADPDPALLSPWPISRSLNWGNRVNRPVAERELSAIRKSAQKGSPHGWIEWIEQAAARLGLASTPRK